MYCKSRHILKQHTKVDQCGIIKQMLELKEVRQTTKETQGFVSRSSDSLLWILHLRWGTRWVWVSFNSIPWVRSLSTTSPILLSWSFPPRGQDHTLTDLPLLPTTLLNLSTQSKDMQSRWLNSQRVLGRASWSKHYFRKHKRIQRTSSPRKRGLRSINTPQIKN